MNMRVKFPHCLENSKSDLSDLGAVIGNNHPTNYQPGQPNF